MVNHKCVTYEEICSRVKERCPEFDEKSMSKNYVPMSMTSYQSDSITNTIQKFIERGGSEEKLAKELLENIFSGDKGKFYETLVYGWLFENAISFIPQPRIEADDCFKKNSHYFADGCLSKEAPVIFDVKAFGLGAVHLNVVKHRLQEKFPDYIITTEGSLDFSTAEIEKHLLQRIPDIAKAIEQQIEKGSCNYTPPGLDNRIEIRFIPAKYRIGTAVSELDVTAWAQNNRFYFLNHGSQFCVNMPYLIFCPFDSSLGMSLSTKDDERIYWQLRFLCRRIFIELTHMYDRKLVEFDGKAKDGISVAAAARKLSAISFLDVTDKWDYNNCRMWVFTNPNADHPIYKYQLNSWFKNYGAHIDGFEYDNY